MPSSDARAKPAIEPSPRLTLCLAIDLKQSTSAGLRLSTRRLDRFNLALINQLTPHLRAVGLASVRMKFTGDGWLLMSSDPDHAAPLCCLAVIMACNFQAEMGREASIPVDQVPALRLAVCWARDLEVELPDGQIDFVGDSVRHAVRACQVCLDNEILIDETVQRWVQHDFVTTRIDLEERLRVFPTAKMEQDLALHSLAELRVESASEADAPVYYVNTLTAIGRSVEAEALADRIADQLQIEAVNHTSNSKELRVRFNRLLSSNLDYENASRILSDMQAAGLAPDQETFTALIMKAEDYKTKCIWLQRMKQKGLSPDLRTFNKLIRSAENRADRSRWIAKLKREGLQPDVVTLNTLIERETDYRAAVRSLERLEEQGVKPEALTFDLLIDKSGDVATGMRWIDRMFKAGIQPDVLSFLTLFAKDVGEVTADDLLGWYLNLPYHPSEPMQRAIAAYRRRGDIDGALRLALDYPYTEAAKKIFRAHSDRALAYFERIVEVDPRHPNGAYALGVGLMELGRHAEAEPWVRRALDLAAPGPRRDELTRHLAKLSAKPAGNDALAVVTARKGAKKNSVARTAT
jgi:tetratricopeptide (TPR) repeat protein